MKLFLVGIIIIVTLGAGVIAATLIKNQAQFSQPPDLMSRLTVYLDEHTAATSDNHSFPELLTPVFFVGAERLFKATVEVASEQGWQVTSLNDENLKVELVIESSLFRFKDDMVVQVVLRKTQNNSEESALNIRSSSRKGKADFGANAGHIQTLVQAIREKLG
jgi:uncharacterized protein (DUF1499 family)